MSSRRPGFTLVELLFTMIIVGILAAIAVSLFWKAKDRGLESALRSDLKTAAQQQEQYFEASRTYASTVTSLPDFATSPGVEITFTYAAADGWAGVAEHPSIVGTRCALLMGEAPAGSADPATAPGIVMCTHQ